MTEAEIQKKLKEWLAIKGEADALEKADYTQEFHRQQIDTKGVNKPQMSSTPGQSNMGTVVRQANSSPRASFIEKMHAKMGGPTISQTKEGKMDSAKGYAKSKLTELKAMPKPNLPKSEPVEKGSTAVLAGSEKLDKSKYLTDMLKQVRAQKKLPATPAAGNTLDYSKMKPAPSGGRVEGQRMHPRSLGTSTPKSNTLFDPQLSGKIKKSLLAQPAQVSAPAKVNRGTMTEPKEIPSPVMVNAYKDKK